MSHDEAKKLFIVYQSLYMKYSESTLEYEQMVGRKLPESAFFKCAARRALELADYYGGFCL